MIPPDIKDLKTAGFVCTQWSPLLWRARGQYEYAEVWPLQRLVRRGESSAKPKPYEDAIEAVEALIVPFPMPSAREQAMTERWRRGLEDLHGVIHKRGIDAQARNDIVGAEAN